MDTINYQKPKIQSRFIKYTEVRRTDNSVSAYQTQQHLHQNKGVVRNMKIGRTQANNEEARFPVYGVESVPKNKDEFDLSEITIQFEDEVQTLYVGPVEIKENTIASTPQTTQRTETVIIAPKAQAKQEIVQNIPKSHAIPAKVIQKTPKHPANNKNRGFVDSLQAQKCVMAASTASVSTSHTQTLFTFDAHTKQILTDRNCVQHKKTAQQKLDCVGNVIHGTTTTNTTANVNTNPLKNVGISSESKKVTGLSHFKIAEKSSVPDPSIIEKQAKLTQNKKHDKSIKTAKRVTQSNKGKQSVINQHFVKIEKGGAALLLQNEKDYKIPSPANSDSGIENCVEETLDNAATFNTTDNDQKRPKNIPEIFKKLNLCPTSLHPAVTAKPKASQQEIIETIIVDPVTETDKRKQPEHVIVETIIVDPEPENPVAVSEVAAPPVNIVKEKPVEENIVVVSPKKKRGRPSKKDKIVQEQTKVVSSSKPPFEKAVETQEISAVVETSITEDTPVLTDLEESITIDPASVSENILILEAPVAPEKDTPVETTASNTAQGDTNTETSSEGDDVLIEIVLKNDSLNTSGSNFKPVEYICPKCPKKMAFKNEVWYKKHLVNYHGVDLSNIAQFLANLQQIDAENAESAEPNSILENLESAMLEDTTVLGQEPMAAVELQDEDIAQSGKELDIQVPLKKNGKNMDVLTKAIKKEKSERKRKLSVSSKNSDMKIEDGDGKSRYKKNKVSLIFVMF